MSDDDDAAGLSHITSKMPAPPPRPPSIASSTRSSSKRSSTASSFHRQSRHASIGGEGELNEAPPTPSISSLYTSVTLFDELPPHMLDPSSSSTAMPLERSASMTASRLGRRRSSSSGVLQSGKRRNSRALKERDREGPGALIAALPPIVASPLPTKDSMTLDSTTHHSVVLSISKYIPTIENLDAERLYGDISTFLKDVGRAFSSLLSLVIWPIVLAMIESVAGYIDGTVGETIIYSPSKEIPDPAAIKSLEKAFAERFKYIICTSFLLTSSLSISSYDQITPPLLSTPVRKTSRLQTKPRSKSELRQIKATSLQTQESRSSLRFTSAGVLFFDAGVAAIILLLPFADSWQAWSRSIVCLVSLVYIIVFNIGMDDGSDVSFETSHQPMGSYSLRDYDTKDNTGSSSDDPSVSKASYIKESLCDQVTALMKACKGFDIECNKAIAAVQEVELVSRGFKLSHPLPPISRIEANNTMMSPPRLRNGSVQGNNSNLNAIRLSRSSSGGASAASNWKHHGSRPQSILFNSSQASDINGRSSPQEAEVDSFRMASLRKGLTVSFEDAKDALCQALEGLEPLVDRAELKLLQDMYELDHIQEESNVFMSSTSLARSMAEKRSSRVFLTRLRLEDEPISPTSNDEGDRPATPQRFSLLFDNNSVGSSARKRDSGMSETWSVASPSRESPTVRGGSRLGYISDKATTSSTTPNQTAESKRLSYISSSNAAHSPLHAKPFSMQQTLPTALSRSNSRKRGSILQTGLLDDLRQPVNSTSYHNRNDAYLISSLKSSFEKVHSLRKKVLCHLLALDFALVHSSATASPTKYWASVSYLMKQLTKTMQRLANDCTRKVETEVGECPQSSVAASPHVQHDIKEQFTQDFTGVEDRIAAMGLTLRSIQVKMLVCAKELKVKNPPALHGTSVKVPSEEGESCLTSPHEKSEKIFETIREDLLTLSAEWENALKIIRTQSAGVTGDTTFSTINSSRLDSPQEAEEDALRQWVQARRGDDDSDSEDERAASRIIESGLLQWTGLDGKEDRWQERGNLSELLIKTATPDHLPPPGLEMVYESVGGQAEAKREKSALSRQERIRLAKLERAEAIEKPVNTEVEASSRIMEELQAVMKNRKSLRGVENGSREAGLSLLPQQHQVTPPTSIDDKLAAFAF